MVHVLEMSHNSTASAHDVDLRGGYECQMQHTEAVGPWYHLLSRQALEFGLLTLL